MGKQASIYTKWMVAAHGWNSNIGRVIARKPRELKVTWQSNITEVSWRLHILQPPKAISSTTIQANNPSPQLVNNESVKWDLSGMGFTKRNPLLGTISPHCFSQTSAQQLCNTQFGQDVQREAGNKVLNGLQLRSRWWQSSKCGSKFRRTMWLEEVGACMEALLDACLDACLFNACLFNALDASLEACLLNCVSDKREAYLEAYLFDGLESLLEDCLDACLLHGLAVSRLEASLEAKLFDDLRQDHEGHL